MNSNYKIHVSEINGFDSERVSGRVISQEADRLFLSDQSGITALYSGTNYQNNFLQIFKEGDIVEIGFEKLNGRNIVTSMEILNSVRINPVNLPESSYFKMNKNDRHLIGILKRKNLFFEEIRNYFKDNGFIEIHTPLLVESPGIETYIEPFSTEYVDHGGAKHKYYLPTSPEFSLKEAVMSGLEKIFEITKSFRNNGEKSGIHRPEFFMLEWYRAFCSYETIMDDCALLINRLASHIYKTSSINYKEFNCSLNEIKKVSVRELFAGYDINLDDYSKNERIFKKQIVDFYLKKDIDIHGDLQKDDLFFKFFMDFIEPDLGYDHPVIVYEYPYEMAALSRRCSDNDLYAERFELYICGIEIANAFGELTDPALQEENFKKIISSRNSRTVSDSQMKPQDLKMPENFLQVLKYGLPPCSGIALGIERLFMLFENLSSINDADLYKF